MLIQHAQGNVQGGNSVSVTLGATGAGHGLIICVTSVVTGQAPSSVTLGGSGTGFSQNVTVTDTNTFANIVESIWDNLAIAGGQTALVVNFTSPRTPWWTCTEVSGLVSRDVSHTGQGGSTLGSTFDSGSAATTQAAEFWVGVAGVIGNTTHPTLAASGWTSESQQNVGSLTSQLSGYQIVSSTGTAHYSGTLTGDTGYYAALAATYSSTAAPVPYLSQNSGMF